MVKSFTVQNANFTNSTTTKPFDGVDISVDGYEPIGVVGYSFGFQDTSHYKCIVVVGCVISAGGIAFRAITTAGTYTGNITVNVMYKKLG